MINNYRKILAVTFAAAFGLVGCGGGGGDEQVAGIDRTGSPTTSYGAVTTFGSVVVNGVRYDTSRAQFMIDGTAGTQNDLAVGDVVLVKGTLDAGGTTGVATSVGFDNAVEGPISSIDVVAGTFVVLGQVVSVGLDTSFDASLAARSIADLVSGVTVEVSGFVQSDGSIRATRIESKLAGGLELTGVVSNLDTAAHTFRINAQPVDYSAVVQLEDFPAGGIANGQLVEVKGTALLAGALRATRVEYEGGNFAGAAGEWREIEGFITRFGSASDFDVAGVRVTTSNSTVVQGALGLNAKVEVEGALNGSGVLVATKVEVRSSSAVRIVALVDSVNPAAASFATLGITVKIDSRTRIEDKTSQQVRPFTLTSLVAGDYVEVRGSESPVAGEVLASLVERDEPDPDSELQGFVQTVAPPSTFAILGVQISTTGARFRDASGGTISAAQFYAALDTGDLVKVTGQEIGDRAIQAIEVELEN